MTSMITLIRTQYSSNYENLGTHMGGLPVFNDKGKPGWKILKGKLKVEDIERLCQELCKQNDDIATLPNLLHLVNRVNKLWFEAQNISFIREDLPNNIQFSSKSEKYSFLSNFFPTLVLINNRIYPSAENAYQTQKLLISGQETGDISTTSAKKAKKLNKHLATEDREKLRIMNEVVIAKFSCNTFLKNMLINTRDVPLIERTGSTFWGKDDQDNGTNFLGKILMKVRKDLALNSKKISEKKSEAS